MVTALAIVMLPVVYLRTRTRLPACSSSSPRNFRISRRRRPLGPPGDARDAEAGMDLVDPRRAHADQYSADLRRRAHVERGAELRPEHGRRSCCLRQPARFSCRAKRRRAMSWPLLNTELLGTRALAGGEQPRRRAAAYLARPARHTRTSPDRAQSSARRRRRGSRKARRRNTFARRMRLPVCCSATCATS